MADEIPEAAIRAGGEKLLDLICGELDSEECDYVAREVLAAALPHLHGAAEQRVVLIKAGDRLIIGGIEVNDADWIKHFMGGLREIGFPQAVLTDQDASIAVAEKGGELDVTRANLRQLRSMVSYKLGFDVELPVPTLVVQLFNAEVRRTDAGGVA